MFTKELYVGYSTGSYFCCSIGLMEIYFRQQSERMFLRKSTKQTDNEVSDEQDGVAGNMERCVPVASRQNYAKYMPLIRVV